MSVEIVDTYGLPVVFHDDAFVLEEDRTYHVSTAGASAASLDGRALVSAAPERFVIALDHAVGAHELTVVTPAGPVHHILRVSPRSTKLTPALWAVLLSDIEAWVPGASLGIAGPRHGAVGLRGVSASFLVEALLPLLPGFEAALREVLREPRQLVREEVSERRLREQRRVDASTLVWIGRHPEVARWLDGWAATEAIGTPPSIPTHVPVATVDHPANRHVAWQLRRVIARLDEVARALEVLSARRDDLGWCGPRAIRARAAAERLEQLRVHSWLGRLASQPPDDAALLVAIDDPRYARFHRHARPFCSPAFRLTGERDDPGAAVRPSYSIYELWCCLALQRLLARSLVDWRWTSEGTKHLLVPTGSGEGAVWTPVRGEERVRLEFNPTFRSWYARGKSSRYSLSKERRPDFVISFDRPGQPGRWLILDAKYRAGRENLADALESLHIYRDALWDEERGGRCEAGMLLVPAACDVKDWFLPTWHERQGLGITVLAPGDSAPEHSLFAWIHRSLGLGEVESVEHRSGRGTEAASDLTVSGSIT